MKKVIIFGGGTGLSTLLRGLKLLPIDITAVVSVCDDGSSTGKLREEFNIFAVGDLRKVIVSLSATEPLIEELFNYRALRFLAKVFGVYPVKQNSADLSAIKNSLKLLKNKELLFCPDFLIFQGIVLLFQRLCRIVILYFYSTIYMEDLCHV